MKDRENRYCRYSPTSSRLKRELCGALAGAAELYLRILLSELLLHNITFFLLISFLLFYLFINVMQRFKIIIIIIVYLFTSSDKTIHRDLEGSGFDPSC